MTLSALLPIGLQYLDTLRERGCRVSDTAEAILRRYHSSGLREFRPQCSSLEQLGLESGAYHTHAVIVDAAMMLGCGYAEADMGPMLALYSVDRGAEMRARFGGLKSVVVLMRPTKVGAYDYVFEVAWDGAELWLSALGYPTQRTYHASQYFVFA